MRGTLCLQNIVLIATRQSGNLCDGMIKAKIIIRGSRLVLQLLQIIPVADACPLRLADKICDNGISPTGHPERGAERRAMVDKEKKLTLRELIERECLVLWKTNQDGSPADWVEVWMSNGTLQRHWLEMRRVNNQLYIGTIPVQIDSGIGDGFVQIVEV